jgi:hypothetical protein
VKCAISTVSVCVCVRGGVCVGVCGVRACVWGEGCACVWGGVWGCVCVHSEIISLY